MTRFEEKLKLLAPAPASEGLRSCLAYPGRKRLGWNWIVPMAAAAAGLLTVLLFVLRASPPNHPSVNSDPDAERVFHRIWETIEQAPSLRVSFKREGNMLDKRGGKEEVETSGQASKKQGNRVFISFTERRTAASGTAASASFVVISDGSHLQTSLVTADRAKRTRPVVATPSDLNARFARCLATLTLSTPQSDLMWTAEDSRRLARISDVRTGSADEGFHTLLYKVNPWQVKLWYDPKTLLPVKRTMNIDQIASLTETYSDWVLGEEIPDEQFRIAPDAKDD